MRFALSRERIVPSDARPGHLKSASEQIDTLTTIDRSLETQARFASKHCSHSIA